MSLWGKTMSRLHRVGAPTRAWLTLVLLVVACSGKIAEPIRPPAQYAAFDWAQSPLTEVQFFNEMTTWMDTSNRFTGRNAFRDRQAAFESMARDGFEPAIAAVALFDFVRAESRVDAGAFKRLLAAANTGDLSAQCALYPVYFLSVKSFPVPDPAATLSPLLQDGAKRGHFACQFYMGVFLAEGRQGFGVDQARAEPLIVAAAVQGSVRAQKYQAFRIGPDRIDDLRKAEEALCWMASTYRHSKYEGADMFANGIRFKAMDVRDGTGNDELLRRVEALIDHWLISRNPTQPKDTDPHECLNYRK